MRRVFWGAVYLARDAAAYYSGTIIELGGGYYAL
jgi:hypothetical protein